MGIKTLIDYCDSTCNLMMGCDGCELFPAHCYAYRMTKRYAGRPGWPKDFTKPELFPGRLDEALRWKDLTGTHREEKPWLDGMPRIIFLNDLGDSFTESIEEHGWLGQAVAKMAVSKHIFLLLTKRPNRLAVFTEWWMKHYAAEFPRNVWGGTTITGPETLWRVGELLHARLAVRFLSCEPLLEFIQPFAGTFPGQIDWVIAGGENGPGARPSHLDWFRNLRDQCQAVYVPFFFKGRLGFPKIDGREWREMPALGERDWGK